MAHVGKCGKFMESFLLIVLNMELTVPLHAPSPACHRLLNWIAATIKTGSWTTAWLQPAANGAATARRYATTVCNGVPPLHGSALPLLAPCG